MKFKNIGKLALATSLALASCNKEEYSFQDNVRIDSKSPMLEQIIEESTPEINQKLIQAVIYAESNGNSQAERYESKIDDTSYGLMQILTETAKDISKRNPDLTSLDLDQDGNTTYNEVKNSLLNPKTNVEYGTRFLEENLERFGTIDLALAAYNAGQGAVVNALTQYELNKILGENLDTDGKIGPQSKQAVRKFQEKYGLDVDGKPGPLTRKKLNGVYSSLFPDENLPTGMIPKNGITEGYVEKILNRYNSSE
jgi:peptidoglycan hydrolase-like protein with peptidoglycan-binding domain